ncbi:DUF6481 family protein [Sphingoaurantiacus capsulatus]|uniref:DUF6481 family protein n=1 Tax=Sphingoaurantiacus capsulatus TaxID=1771310 RepID=A0ABV7X753_9SPHN
MKNYGNSFSDRRDRAAKAREALLEKLVKKPAQPAAKEAPKTAE